ncbi:MAG: ATPase P [Lachnospiraceae bacterium]|jgi:copper chaperone CopZ|nr:ATPase P [Lachnospiraceae bacterium]
MNIGPIILVFASIAALIWVSTRRLNGGSSCCGSGEKAEKKVRVADRNPKHYQYHYIANIEGMVCGNCARRVENAFNIQTGIFAKVDLEKKAVYVHSKYEITYADAYKYLNNLPYTLMDIRNNNDF